jgi:NAD(P)-dependent dehydrogenase (short-subunit alcohol dehydrogenase family)
VPPLAYESAMDMTDLTGKTALVTGAASGIGRATALAFARRGAGLVICDVNEKGLDQVADQIRGFGREALARRVDVADREQMKDFAAAVHERVEAVDILMNNAGVGLAAGLLDTTLDDWEWILGINLWGVIHGCHFFLPAMVRRGRGGHVINVSSSAGFTPSEMILAYCATKFAVLGLSESLQAELEPHGIGVTAVCPGIIYTGIVESARARGAQASEVARQQSVDMFRRRNYTPERVAENIVKAVQRNRVVAPIAPEAWLMYYLKRFAPGLLAWLNRRLKERLQRDWASV